ncbi:hypothetical protein BGX12_13427 [Fibrobacter sp. UWR4]|nr:hypothetical protein BGX12_13427 [Fibrobacter sp. UWR4]PZW62779.1 hypothetical protein C8E88_105310 [Fibrobacter sp. UWR1]
MKSKFILSVASFIGLSAGLFCACSDNPSTAGTAEEPNQIAIEDVSSSSVILSSSSMVSSSSSVIPSGSEESSSSFTPPGSERDDRPTVVPPSNSELPKTLDNFVKQYVNDVNTKFDDNVLAYNLVYEKQCGGASDDCEDAAPVYYELTTPGLHKDMDMSHVEMMFPKTIDYLAKTPSVDEYCPFYLLNISPLGMDGYYSPEAGFVLANIEGGKLTVIALRSHTCESTNKDRVFGILFRYCGELSSNPKIEFIESDGRFETECRPANSIDVSSEWVNKILLR